jgi:hypothetical protein
MVGAPVRYQNVSTLISRIVMILIRALILELKKYVEMVKTITAAGLLMKTVLQVVTLTWDDLVV